MPPQIFSLDFSQFPNFTSLYFGYIARGLLGMDTSFIGLSSFVSYAAFDAYSPSSAYYGVIPDYILAKSTLTSITFGDEGFGNKTFAQNKMDAIAPSFPNLRFINIFRIPLTNTNGGQGAFPANFASISTLVSISVDTSQFTSIPSVIGTYPALSSVNFSYNAGLNSWGDFSGLGEKLTMLAVTRCINLTEVLPAYFSQFTKLKAFVWRGLGGGIPGKIDSFITNLYDLIVANAAMAGAATLDFRGVRVNIESESGTNGVVPVGIYQRPAGYVAGVSNGTPATSLERVWVLVNQYLHTWTYRQV